MKAISLLFLLFSCATKPPEDPYDFIKGPLMAKVPELRDCYMNSRNYLKNPGAEIRTKVEFDLNLDGTTSAHKVLESSLKDPKFDQCVVTKLKTLKYQPQKEAIIVEQAFNFYPRNP